MNKAQLQRKAGKLQLFLMMLICFFMSGFSGYSQEVFKDPVGTTIGTSDSRVAATIVETEAGVTMQVIAVGEMVFDVLEFTFFVEQSELRWSDKTFTQNGPYQSHPGFLFDSYVELNPDMRKFGADGVDFVFTQVSTRNREAGLASATPELTHWSDMPDMDALRIQVSDLSGQYQLPAGEIKHIFTCYFKKLHSGRALQKSDIGIGVKTTIRGGNFGPRWLYAGSYITYDDANPGTAKQWIRPELFLYRTPSSVAVKGAGEITPITAEINGSFLRGSLSLPPATDLLDGREPTFVVRNKGRLGWNEIAQNGFIYTSNPAVTSLYVKEYTDLLFINGEQYLFPNSTEIAAGEFTRGGYTFYIKMADNSQTGSSVDYSLTLEDLDPATPYLAWPCIAYTFETSREYFMLGDSFSFTTEPDCFAPLPPVAISQSFCGSATVEDLSKNTVVPAGSVLEWYDTPTVTGSSLDPSTPLVDGIYYARASETVITTCYSDSVEVTVKVGTGLGSSSVVTPQLFCSGAKVSDLQALGSNIQWYDQPDGGSALNPGAELSDGIYYAAQSDGSSCQSDVRTPVQVKIGTLDELPAPNIASPQSLCGVVTLEDIATDGTSLKWYNAAGTEIPLSTELTFGSTYYAAQLSGSCESASRTAVEVVEGAPTATPAVNASQSFCQGATLASIEVPNNQIIWYSAAIGGALLPGSTILADGVTYYAAQKAGTCESNRKAVTVSIGSSLAPVGPNSQVFCISATVSDLEVSGAAVVWYDNAEGNGDSLGLAEPLATGSYYAFQGGSGSCNRQFLRVDVIILESGLTAPHAERPQTFCDGATVANLQAIGSNIKWYNDQGVLLLETEKLVNGRIYHATQSTRLCESVTRTPVRVIINEVPGITLDVRSPQSLCEPAYISDIAVNTVGNVTWYSSATGNGKFELTDVVSAGVYYAELQVGGCPAPRVPVEIRITINRPMEPEFDASMINQYFCPGAILSNIHVPNNQVIWYLAPSGGSPLSSDYLLPESATGYTLYAAQTAGSCQSAGRVPVIIKVSSSSLPAPYAMQRQVICETGATLADLRVTGTGIIWYDAAENGSTHAGDKVLVNGETYHAAQSASNNCESTLRTPITVVINPEIEIVQAPVNTYLCPGESAYVTFNVTAVTDNASVLNYQWFDQDGEPIGVHAPVLSVLSEEAMGKTYSVVVGNECYSLDNLEASVGENLSVIVQKRNHTLVVNNNPDINGGYTFEYYSWYRNDLEIQPKIAGGESRGGYYYSSAGLDMGVKYYAIMWDAAGNEYRSCPFTPQPKASGAVSVYPNPLISSQFVYVDADLDEEALEKASVEIYSPLGAYVGKVKAQRVTPVRLPEEKGVYILKFKAEETEENFKVIVK